MSLDTALERPPSLFALFHAAGNCRQSRTKGSSSKLGKGLHRAHRGPTCDRGPRAAKMGAPRTELGWRFDHFIGYFGITLFFCFAWPRPFLVGGIFMALAALLEGLQAFTPDRSAYLPAIFYGAGGALAAVLVAQLFIRAWYSVFPVGSDQISGKHDRPVHTRG
jgi:hypothetical protein